MNHAGVWTTSTAFTPTASHAGMVGHSRTHLDMTFGFKFKVHIHETSLRNIPYLNLQTFMDLCSYSLLVLKSSGHWAVL